MAVRARAWSAPCPPTPHRSVRPSPPQAGCATTGRSQEVEALFALPFMDLILRAQRVHRAHHAANTVQMSTLLSIKTGACPEDCAYCPQSVRYDTGVEREALMEVEAVRDCAARAKAAGATRFCMGAAYRSPKAKDLEAIAADGARGARARPRDLRHARHADARHRRSSSRPRASTTTTTTSTPRRSTTARSSPRARYQDRLDTLDAVRAAGLKVCCGGILGMGESARDRAQLLRDARQPARAPRERADQPPGAGARHAAGGGRGRRPVRLRAHASRWRAS